MNCPSCQKPLVNRAKEKCLYCGKPVPEALLFSREERERRAQMRLVERLAHEEHDRKIAEIISNRRQKRWWQFWKRS